MWIKIKADSPIFSIGCKKRPEVNITKYEGKVMAVQIRSSDKVLWSFVPPPGSEAREDGNDFMFAICSKDCGTQLKEALEKEKEIGDIILSANHL